MTEKSRFNLICIKTYVNLHKLKEFQNFTFGIINVARISDDYLLAFEFNENEDYEKLSVGCP